MLSPETIKSVPTAFAVLDILGYGALMVKEPREVLALIQDLVATSARNWPVQRGLNRYAHFASTLPALIVEYAHFSDTLLIYVQQRGNLAQSDQQPELLMTTVCYAASLTLGTFIAAGIPLRGSVGFGPSFICRDPLFFTGAELYETIKLEREQSWAGAALRASAVAALENESTDQFAVDYPIPLKSANVCPPKYAIDWVTCHRGNPPIVPPWSNMFTGNDASLSKKREETKRFYDYVMALKRSCPVYLDRASVDTMRQRFTSLQR